MARQGFFAIDDANKKPILMNSGLTSNQADLKMRQIWAASVAAAYKRGLTPGFGGGYTIKDEAWLSKVEKQAVDAIRWKRKFPFLAWLRPGFPKRPKHKDPQIEGTLRKLGL